MVFTQLARLPLIFRIGEGIYTEIQSIISKNNIFFKKVLLVSGTSISSVYAKDIVDKTQWEVYQVFDNTHTQVDQLKKYVIDNRLNLLVAVGGGKVLDIVKRVSYLININHISIPTIISNDGLISPIAVIKNDLGRTESLPGMTPMGVLIDINIIKKAPQKYIRAAAGDILSNLSATNDWILSNENTGESINDFAFQLSKSAASTLVFFKDKSFENKYFINQIVQGQLNSGVAMSLAGTSRPCSGSEHLISHAIDYLNLAKESIHGIQVASISLFALFVQNKLKDFYIDYALQTEIPLLFTDLLIEINNSILIEMFDKAREMRPNRFTVLDILSNQELLDKLEEYKRIILSFSKKRK